MISVVENKRHAEGFDLLWSQTLDRPLGSHGHECWQHRDTI